MNVIRDSADAERLHLILAGDAAEEGPEAFFHVIGNDGSTVLGAENVMDVYRGISIGH